MALQSAVPNTRHIIDDTISEIPGVKSIIGISGFSIFKGAVSPNSALAIIVLEDWSERPEEGGTLGEIVPKVMPRYSKLTKQPALLS